MSDKKFPTDEDRVVREASCANGWRAEAKEILNGLLLRTTDDFRANEPDSVRESDVNSDSALGIALAAGDDRLQEVVDYLEKLLRDRTACQNGLATIEVQILPKPGLQSAIMLHAVFDRL